MITVKVRLGKGYYPSCWKSIGSFQNWKEAKSFQQKHYPDDKYDAYCTYK